MTRTRWLWLIAAAGLAIFAISFVQGWIIHQRELRGEGYRLVQIFLSAWRGVAIPVTAAASVVALATGLLAAAAAIGRVRPPGWLLVGGAAIVIGLIGASAWPVTQTGHASTVRLGPWYLLPVALALGAIMLVASVAAVRPAASSPRRGSRPRGGRARRRRGRTLAGPAAGRGNRAPLGGWLVHASRPLTASQRRR